MLNTLIQTLLILNVWVIVLASFAGIGRFVVARLKIQPLSLLWWGEFFWIGWAVVINFLQIWHVFARIYSIVFVLVALTGCSSLIYYAYQDKIILRQYKRIILFLLIIGGFIGFWIANRALWYMEPLSGFTQWDTGSYHLQSVKWNSQYPLIPGLANLNHYFGFNSNYFLYASMFDFWLWDNRSSYLATGLLLFAMVLQSLNGIYRMFSSDEVEAKFSFYLGLALVPLLLKATFVNSLETDLPIFMLMILLGGQVYLFFLEREKNRYENGPYRFFFITILVLVGLTIKMNIAIYGLVALGVVTCATLVDGHRQPRVWGKTFLPLFAVPFCLITIPWLVRSVIISGYPLFPSNVFAVNVPWRVPAEVAKEEFGHIRTVARVIKSGVDETLIQGWDWFPAWIRDIPEEIVKLVNLSFAAILTLTLPFSQSKQVRLNGWLFVPFLVAFPVWFWMAPAIRFIEGAFWSTVLLTTCLAVERLVVTTKNSKPLFRWLVVVVLFLWMMPFSSPLFIVVKTSTPYQFQEPYMPNLIRVETLSGLTVLTPKKRRDALRCWNAPLPCVPIFNERLGTFQLRFAGHKRTGYWISK